MTVNIDTSKHKVFVVAVASLVSFFGFEAANIAIKLYEIKSFLLISLVVYLFLVFWQTLVFNLHLGKRNAFKWEHFIHFQNYLILPGIIYWTTVVLIFLNPFDELVKQAWIVLSTLCLGVSFWYLKTVFYAHKQAGKKPKQLIFLIKLYGSYLAFAAALGIAKYYGPISESLRAENPGYFAVDSLWLGALVFSIVFLLMHQALFQHHYLGHAELKFLLGAGMVMGAAGFFVNQFWNVNYYSGALVLAALYNTFWGLVQHKYVDRDITREIVYEYLAVLFVILVIVIGSTNFGQKLPPPN